MHERVNTYIKKLRELTDSSLNRDFGERPGKFK